MDLNLRWLCFSVGGSVCTSSCPFTWFEYCSRLHFSVAFLKLMVFAEIGKVAFSFYLLFSSSDVEFK